MCENKIVQLAEIEDSGEIELGRGNVISTGDLAANPGNYPVYSSSAVGSGEFGRYGRYMFDEPLITWSVDGGGRPFLRKKHRFSVTNVCGYLRIIDSKKWNYGYLHAAILKAHEKIQFDYQAKAHPSVIRDFYHLRWVPINEQRLIARILDNLDTQIQQTEALIAKLEKVKEGLLHDLLTRGIDESGQLRPSPEQAPELYKESPLGLIPREWEVGSLGELSTSSVIGPFGSDLVASDYRAEGVPVVFVRDVVSKTFTWKSDVYVDCQKAASLSAHDVVGGDVLLTKMGLPPCIACTYPSDFSAGIVTADIVRLRLNKKIVLSDWGSNYANSEHVAAQVRGITSGVTRPKVTLNDVRSLKISVPPLEDQQAILLRVAEANRRVAAARKSLNKLISEKTGLMDDLLTGRVRVTPLLD